MSDRLVLECPDNYDDMADELDIDDPEGVEEIGVEDQDISGEESESGISDIAVIQSMASRSPLVIVQEQEMTDIDSQEDLEDLEQSLQVLVKGQYNKCIYYLSKISHILIYYNLFLNYLKFQALEKLDRSSPDLWPEHSIPGVNQFLPPTPHYTEDQDTQHSDNSGYLQNLSREDLETLMQLGSLTVPMLMGEVKRLQNIAYQLGQEETKEMTRGKYLNILKRRNN